MCVASRSTSWGADFAVHLRICTRSRGAPVQQTCRLGAAADEFDRDQMLDLTAGQLPPSQPRHRSHQSHMGIDLPPHRVQKQRQAQHILSLFYGHGNGAARKQSACQTSGDRVLFLSLLRGALALHSFVGEPRSVPETLDSSVIFHSGGPDDVLRRQLPVQELATQAGESMLG